MGTLFKKKNSLSPMYCKVWNKTLPYISTDNPKTLKMAKIPLVKQLRCRELYYSYYSKHTMVCAGYEDKMIHISHGDSGGPLVCKVNGIYWKQSFFFLMFNFKKGRENYTWIHTAISFRWRRALTAILAWPEFKEPTPKYNLSIIWLLWIRVCNGFAC